jgi:hypothetical protein
MVRPIEIEYPSLGYFWDTLLGLSLQSPAKRLRYVITRIVNVYRDMCSIAVQGIAWSCSVESALLRRRSQVGLLPGSPLLLADYA